MNAKSVVTFILVTVGILVGVTALLWNFGSANPNQVIADVAGSARHTKGQGPVTIVEFSDLQCPACQAVQEPLKQLLATYESKVKFVYRHFPLTTIHKNALAASYAVEAAHKQGKFWEMHDILFDKQSEWEKEGNAKEKFAMYAKDLGMDVESFKKDLDSQEVKDAVTDDNLAATRYKLTGTPTFFVNGVKTEFQDIEAKIKEISP